MVTARRANSSGTLLHMNRAPLAATDMSPHGQGSAGLRSVHGKLREPVLLLVSLLPAPLFLLLLLLLRVLRGPNMAVTASVEGLYCHLPTTWQYYLLSPAHGTRSSRGVNRQPFGSRRTFSTCAKWFSQGNVLMSLLIFYSPFYPHSGSKSSHSHLPSFHRFGYILQRDS